MISDTVVPLPVEYLPTGDHALLMAWVRVGEWSTGVILCLEDGRAVQADLDEIKFDYRYDVATGAFVDVSGFFIQGGSDVDTDQEDADDGSAGVQGQVPAPD